MPEAVCPSCGAAVHVTDEMLGRPVQCGGCGDPFTPPVPPPRPQRFGGSRPGSRFGDDDRHPGRYGDDDDRDDRRFDDDDEDYEPRRRRNPADDYATASLVLGIGSLVGALPLAFCCPYLIVPVALLAVVLGVLGLKSDIRTQAIAGIVTGGLALLGILAAIGVIIAMVASVPKPPPPGPPAPAWQNPASFR